MFVFSNGKLRNMAFPDILSSGGVRSRSCRGSEHERLACDFMLRVTARDVRSTLYKRQCHRDDSRVVIPKLSYFSTLFVSSRRHEGMLEILLTAPTSRVLRLTVCIDTTSYTSSRRKENRGHSTRRVDLLVLVSAAANWPQNGPTGFLPRIRRSLGPIHLTNGPRSWSGTFW